MRTRIFNSQTVDRGSWNAAAARVPEGTVFQTTFWADFLEEYLLYRPVYFLLEEAGETKAICLGFITAYNHYGYFEKPILHHLLPFQRRWFPSFTSQEGMLALEEDEERRGEITRLLLAEIISFCRRRRVIGIDALTLPVLGHPRDLLEGDDPLVRKEWATYLVNLQQSEESAWRNLRHAARKAVNKAARDGVRVEQAQDEAQLRRLHEFNRAESLKQGRKVYSYRNLSAMWRHLRGSGCLNLFVAYCADAPIGSLGIWHYNGNLYEFAAVQSGFAYERKLYAGDALRWEVMRWGIQSGHRWYNLAGVNPHPATPKEEGIRRFKEKWGGEYREYFEYHLPLSDNPFLNALKKGRQLLRSWRRAGTWGTSKAGRL